MRKKYTLITNIPISNLQLDVGNFRIGNAENQRECIALMLAEKRSKEQLFQLAKDIANRGLSPMPIIVVKSSNGNYIVKDGNRRVAALKLLNNPNEAPENLRATFATISKISTESYSSVDCYLTDDASALEFMELAHLGFQDGIGQIPWGSNEKDNLMEFKGEKTKNDVAREVITYLNNNGISGTNKVKITIFQRLFQDKQVRDLIGIEWDGEKLNIIADNKDVINILSEILLDFTERGYITRNIFTAEERINYIEELFARGIQRPRPKGYNSPPAPVKTSPPMPPTPAPPTSPIPYPPKKPSWDRARLIPPRSGLAIPRSETKISNIANELSRKISIKESPNAAAVLLRLLIEFSVAHYSQKYSLKPKKDTLAARIELSAKKLNADGHITDNELEQLEKMREGNEILSTRTLNAWIHHVNYSPDPQTLCIFWDNIAFFINHCWTK